MSVCYSLLGSGVLLHISLESHYSRRVCVSYASPGPISNSIPNPPPLANLPALHFVPVTTLVLCRSAYAHSARGHGSIRSIGNYER